MHKEAWEKIITLIPPPPPTSPASYSPERPFLSRLYCKTIFFTGLILIIFFISKSLLALVRRYGITEMLKKKKNSGKGYVAIKVSANTSD